MSSFSDKDNGANALMKTMAKLAIGTTLSVGILDKGDEPAEGSTDLTVADVATFNEFGYGVPERSFIRGWYDAAEESNKALFRKLYARVIRGDLDLDVMWQQLGVRWVADMQRRIVSHIPPPNAPSTIAKKGSSTPLVDTCQLKSAITFEVK